MKRVGVLSVWLFVGTVISGSFAWTLSASSAPIQATLEERVTVLEQRLDTLVARLSRVEQVSDSEVPSEIAGLYEVEIDGKNMGTVLLRENFETAELKHATRWYQVRSGFVVLVKGRQWRFTHQRPYGWRGYVVLDGGKHQLIYLLRVKESRGGGER